MRTNLVFKAYLRWCLYLCVDMCVGEQAIQTLQRTCIQFKTRHTCKYVGYKRNYRSKVFIEQTLKLQKVANVNNEGRVNMYLLFSP